MNRFRGLSLLLWGAPLLLLARPAWAQTPSEPDDSDAAAPPAPAPEKAPPEKATKANTKKDDEESEPPAPANPHTELESGPPSTDQHDQWPPEPAKGDDPKTYPRLHPFASIVGGGKFDNPIQPPNQDSANRASAIMLSDFGLRGELTSWVSFESELMANGGADLHGTSTFEGKPRSR